jgi:hypothetical protein
LLPLLLGAYIVLVLAGMPGCRSQSAWFGWRRARDDFYRTAHSKPGRKFIEVRAEDVRDIKVMVHSREIHAVRDRANGFASHYARHASLAAGREGHIGQATIANDMKAHSRANAAKHNVAAPVHGYGSVPTASGCFGGRKSWADLSEDAEDVPPREWAVSSLREEPSSLSCEILVPPAVGGSAASVASVAVRDEYHRGFLEGRLASLPASSELGSVSVGGELLRLIALQSSVLEGLLLRMEAQGTTTGTKMNSGSCEDLASSDKDAPILDTLLEQMAEINSGVEDRLCALENVAAATDPAGAVPDFCQADVFDLLGHVEARLTLQFANSSKSIAATCSNDCHDIKEEFHVIVSDKLATLTEFLTKHIAENTANMLSTTSVCIQGVEKLVRSKLSSAVGAAEAVSERILLLESKFAAVGSLPGCVGDVAPGPSSSSSSTCAPMPSTSLPSSSSAAGVFSEPQYPFVGARVMLHSMQKLALNGSLGIITQIDSLRAGVVLDGADLSLAIKYQNLFIVGTGPLPPIPTDADGSAAHAHHMLM